VSLRMQSLRSVSRIGIIHTPESMPSDTRSC
jgi:hypothetical protein